jgi:hypothetical protein
VFLRRSVRVSGFVPRLQDTNPERKKCVGTKEDKDVSSRHFETDRYTLQIEITATPTKQTAGTRANRYNLVSVPLWQIPTKPPGLEMAAND